jgi:hypothetical protein
MPEAFVHAALPNGVLKVNSVRSVQCNMHVSSLDRRICSAPKVMQARKLGKLRTSTSRTCGEAGRLPGEWPAQWLRAYETLPTLTCVAGTAQLTTGLTLNPRSLPAVLACTTVGCATFALVKAANVDHTVRSCCCQLGDGGTQQPPTCTVQN